MKLTLETTKADAICATLIAVVAALLLLVGGCTAAKPQPDWSLPAPEAISLAPTNGNYQRTLEFNLPLLEYETNR